MFSAIKYTKLSIFTKKREKLNYIIKIGFSFLVNFTSSVFWQIGDQRTINVNEIVFIST